MRSGGSFLENRLTKLAHLVGCFNVVSTSCLEDWAAGPMGPLGYRQKATGQKATKNATPGQKATRTKGHWDM